MKTSEQIRAIRTFLQSPDHSANKEMRSVAVEFAATCQELNAQLAECAAAYSRGDSSEAWQIDHSFTPALSERARQLQIPEWDAWRELCQSYAWPCPPQLDRAVLQKLSQHSNQAASLAVLIRKWRGMVRGGDNATKVKILREIVKKEPSHGKTWKKNLHNAEKLWLPELLAAAEQEMVKGNFERVQELQAELTSPKLLSRPEAKRLAAIDQWLKIKQEELTTQRKQQLLTDIASAFSGQSAKALAASLADWRQLLTSAFLRLTPADEQQVFEAERWLTERQHAESQKQQHYLLQQELHRQLDDEVPFAEIDRTYHSLLNLDLPLEDILLDRYQDAKGRFLLQEKRRHLRACLLGFLLVIALTTAITTAIVFVQRYRETADAIQAMRDCLQDENPTAALRVYQALAQKSPALAQRPPVQKLQAEAEGMRLRLAEDEKVFKAIMQRLESELDIDNCDSQSCEQDFVQLETLAAERTGELRKSLDALKQLRRKLQKEKFARQEEEFKSSCQEFNQASQHNIELLQARVLSQEQLSELLRTAEEQLAALKKEALPSEIRERWLPLVEQQHKIFTDSIASSKERLALERSLRQPADWQEYLAALQKMPYLCPELLPEYQKAVESENMWLALAQARMLPGDLPFLSSEKISLWLSRPFIGKYALQRLYFADPAGQQQLRQITAELNRLEQEILSDCDLYELLFLAEDGSEFRLFCEQPPELERSIASRQITALVFPSLSLKSGEKGVAFVLQVNAIKDSQGQQAFHFSSVQKLPGVRLPKTLVALQNVNLTMPEPFFPKNSHFLFLHQALADLRQQQNLESMEKALQRNLLELLAKKNMQPYMRMALLKELLQLLKLTSPLYSLLLDEPLQQLQNCVRPNWNWRNPSESVEHPEEVAAIARVLENVQPDDFDLQIRFMKRLYEISLTRGLTPVAVVSACQDGKPNLHWLVDTQLKREIWLLERTGPGEGYFTCIPDILSGQQSPQALHGYCWQGQLLFSPSDGQNTAILAKKLRAEASQCGLNLNLSLNAMLWPRNLP